MKRIIALCAALLWLGGANAYAQDADHAWGTPGGAIVNGAIGMCLNSSGLAIPIGANCVPAGTVTPSNTSAAPLYVAGFDSGTAPALGAGATLTPANASHTAGKVVGGLFTIHVARIAGGSGAVSRFFGYSVAGDTTGLLWRIWDKSPASTTCTDNANFVGSATDDLHLIAQPFTATPAAPAQTQGDAKTYFENDFVPPASYENQDTSPSVNIYACAVATATYTPGVGAYSVDATGYQN